MECPHVTHLSANPSVNVTVVWEEDHGESLGFTDDTTDVTSASRVYIKQQ